MSSEAPWIFPALAGRRWVGANLDAIARIDFPATDHGNPLNDPWFCDHWVGEVATRLGADHSWGGWLEDRAHLWRGHYLPEAELAGPRIPHQLDTRSDFDYVWTET